MRRSTSSTSRKQFGGTQAVGGGYKSTPYTFASGNLSATSMAQVPGPVPDEGRCQSMMDTGALVWENGSPKSKTLPGLDTGARKSMFG
ncbi:hypothetical protein KC364_g40 [Hortaea werneckii]|nr:hypothetical protein KC364_g40 [Hortaea werneckii]